MTSSTSMIFNLMVQYEKDFIDIIKPLDSSFVVYPRGIWVSEMFAFCALCRALKIQTVIESGVYLGQSTDVLDGFLSSEIQIHSIDRILKEELLARYKNNHRIKFYVGDGEVEIPRLLSQLGSDAMKAILLDGPKGGTALTLTKDCFKDDKNVVFVAIHDVYASSASRSLMESSCNGWYTDDPEFVERYKYMDEGKYDRWMDERGYGKKPYILIRPEGVSKMNSYGPTLGFLFKGGLKWVGNL